jgi:hypothetical protein
MDAHVHGLADAHVNAGAFHGSDQVRDALAKDAFGEAGNCHAVSEQKRHFPLPEVGYAHVRDQVRDAFLNRVEDDARIAGPRLNCCGHRASPPAAVEWCTALAHPAGRLRFTVAGDRTGIVPHSLPAASPVGNGNSWMR